MFPCRGGVGPLLLFLSLMITPSEVWAQRNMTYWYFGNKKGIDFTYEPPRVIESSIFTAEGCANAVDRNTGKILFYTNGITVWNRENEIMENGEELAGHLSSAQAALIIPFPDDSTKFYIFTTDHEGLVPVDTPVVGLSYSIVDLGLNRGKGKVTAKNVNLLGKCTERLVGIQHCNDRDFWVIVKNATSFNSYLISPIGIHSPVVTTIGIPETNKNISYLGYLKASPDRTILALSAKEVPGIQLFKFDPSTGIVNDALLVNLTKGNYCTGFSPNGKILYISAFAILFQCDLTNWNSIAIENSAIGLDTLIFATRAFAGIQLGPDGKLYVGTNSPWISRINEPNVLGAGCGYRDSVILFNSYFLGFPNFIDAMGPGSKCQPPTANLATPDAICEGECIEPRDQSKGAVVNTYWSVIKDGRTVATSRQSPESYCMTTAGEYTIRLVAANSGGSDTTYRSVYVRPSLDKSREIMLELSHVAAYPGDTVTYSIASDRLGDLPEGVYLTGALEYDTTIMTPVIPAIGESGRVRVALANEDTVKIKFVTRAGGVDSASVRWREVHWQNDCAMPVRTKDGSLKLRVRREGDVLVQDGKSTTITPFPNPSIGPMRLLIDLAREGDAKIRIFDAAGRAVHWIEKPLVLGKNWIDLDLQHLTAGSYTVALKSDREYVSESFILLQR